jgi:GNAT superfamily N-acetyltransferase
MIDIIVKNKEGYHISTAKNEIDVELVYRYLSTDSYWATGISKDVVMKSIDNSLCFGVYKETQQVGFARIISDFATYAYLADVFIIKEERRKGLSKWLMKVIIEHRELRGLRRFVLATKDAHGLYEQFGFFPYPNPDRLMCRHNPDVYKRK